MFESVLGETGGTIAQFILALIVVLLLIMLIAWLVRRFGVGRFGGTNAAQAELEVITSLAIDPKRKLVLVRHGKLEHLLLIGGGSDEVIERSMVGGIPIAARVQANKTAQPPQDDQALARPSNGARAAQSFADAVSRKSNDTAPAASKSSGLGTTLAASAGLAAGGLAATAATWTSKPKDMTARAGSAETTGGSQTPPITKASGEAPTATNGPTKAAPDTTPTSQPVKASPAVPAMPQSEREALDQSLDDALSQSLLEPEATTSTVLGPSDLDLERELEAALDLDDFDTALSSDVADAMADLPPLPDLSTLSDDPLPESSPPKGAETKHAETKPAVAETSVSAAQQTDKALDPLSMESVRASRGQLGDPGISAQTTTPAKAPEVAPTRDIPVGLSGRSDPPIPVAIPSRGPASSATTLAKAEDNAASAAKAKDATTPTDAPGKTKPSDDLDNEMRRLLGEIAGDPDTK